MPVDPVIDVRNVHKSFKTVQAVRGVDFQIFPGQSVALLGPNGAGKTTLMEMIEGIQKPDSGEILITGRKWKGNARDLHRIIGLSLQETRFIDRLTVAETLRMFASFHGLGRDRVDEIIRVIALEEKRRAYVMNLSGGQRQRLALGIALLNRPAVLLLDEPTTGLDPNARREIWTILQHLKEDVHTSLVLTTHYMEEAERLCDRIIIIDKGRILKQGTLFELLEEDAAEKIIEFLLDRPAPENGGKTETGPGLVIQWTPDRTRGTLVLDRLETQLQDFLGYLNARGLRLIHLECRRKTLDDLFTAMTGRRLDE